MKSSGTRNSGVFVAVIVIVVLLVVAAAVYFAGETCTVETAMSPVITPNQQAAIDLYSKKCHPRWSSDLKREKEYQVVVLRPITEPPPAGNRYQEQDVVFEVEKGPDRMQLSFGSADTFAFMSKVPEVERKDTLLIGCYLACPAALIRKQLSSWHGQPMHYFRTETPTSPVITQ